jgi:hypothetical protein
VNFPKVPSTFGKLMLEELPESRKNFREVNATYLTVYLIREFKEI